MPGQDLQESAAARRQPGMENKERHRQRPDGDAITRHIEKMLVAFDDQRNVTPCRLQHQRSEHDQECHRQRRESSNQGVADRFQPQPVPAPRLDHRIGTVQANAQAFDAVRGKVHRKHGADGQRVAAGRGEHVVNFARERVGDLFRPDLQHQPRRLVREFLRAEKAGQRRQHDQKRKQRHQGRQRDVAGDRPAVIGEKLVECIHHDQIDVAKLPHISPCQWRTDSFGEPCYLLILLN